MPRNVDLKLEMRGSRSKACPTRVMKDRIFLASRRRGSCTPSLATASLMFFRLEPDNLDCTMFNTKVISYRS